MGAKALVKLVEAERKDSAEAVRALRLQAKAWRIVAIIGTHDQKKAAALVQWLFFKTVPFTDGDAVAEFIEDYLAEAEKAGIASGVFSSPRTKEQM